MKRIPGWQVTAEFMMDLAHGSLKSEHLVLYSRLQNLDGLVKKAKPFGGLSSSQVIGSIVQDYLAELLIEERRRARERIEQSFAIHAERPE